MKTTPLTAAIKRLRAYQAWDPIESHKVSPYANFTALQLHEDLRLVLRALTLLDEAEHVDDRDAEPIFEVRPACSWQEAARKGLVHCLGVVLVDEDAAEEAE